jgi:hypothetical protein
LDLSKLAADGGMKRDEFFQWCEARGLRDNTPIATVFSVSSQTIRNWRKKDGADELPAWVPLACDGFEALSAGGRAPSLPPITVEWLSSWQVRHALRTYEDTARVFAIKRQAVHNWYKRGRFPRWLALACAGHDARTRAGRGRPVSAAA